MSDRCGYLRVCLAVSLSVVSLVLFAVIGVGQTLPQGGVVEETAPQVLLSVTKGSAAGLVSVEAKNITADQVFRTVAQVMGFNIIVAKEVQSARLVAVNIKDSPLEPVLGLLAKASEVTLVREGAVWVVQKTAAQAPRIECAFQWICLKGGTAGGESEWSLAPSTSPEPLVGAARGRFDAQLNALLHAGRTTVVSEPHVVTLAGQPAEISFRTDVPEDSILPKWPDFTCKSLETSIWVLPTVGPDHSISLALSVRQNWIGASPARRLAAVDSAPTGDRISVRVDLPHLKIMDGEEALVGGQALADTNGRRYLLRVKASFLGDH